MPARLRFPRRLLVVALLLLALALPGLALAPPALVAIASAAAPVVDLQQGWRPEEAELYRNGVPAGVEEDAEPLHSVFTFLSTTNFPSVRHGFFWGLQWWDSQVGSPMAVGVKQAIEAMQSSAP